MHGRSTWPMKMDYRLNVKYNESEHDLMDIWLNLEERKNAGIITGYYLSD